MKAAYTEGLLEDDTRWIELLNAQNTTSHIYDEQHANLLYAAIVAQYVGLFDQFDGEAETNEKQYSGIKPLYCFLLIENFHFLIFRAIGFYFYVNF